MEGILVNSRMLAISLVLLSLLLSHASACKCGGDLELEVIPDPVSIEPGKTIILDVVVTNTGDSDKTVNVRLWGWNGKGFFFKDDDDDKWHLWPAKFLESDKLVVRDVTVKAGESETLKLQIDVPLGEKQGHYKYWISVIDFPCEFKCEVGGINLIPEFSTIAIPVGIALLAGLYFFRRQ